MKSFALWLKKGTKMPAAFFWKRIMVLSAKLLRNYIGV